MFRTTDPAWTLMVAGEEEIKDVRKIYSFCCMRDPRPRGMRGRFGARYCARFSAPAQRSDRDNLRAR
jgi:hypothetical protein